MAVTQIFEGVVERALEELLREITFTSTVAPQLSSGQDDRALAVPYIVAYVQETESPDPPQFTGIEIFQCTIEVRSNQYSDLEPAFDALGEHEKRWQDVLGKFLVDPINDTTFGSDATSMSGMINATTIFANEGGRCDRIFGDITREHENEDKIFVSKLMFKGIFTGSFA